MKTTFRQLDYLIRMGGDEFLIVLPSCRQDVATHLAEKLNHKVKSTLLSCRESISISYGVLELQENESFEQALEKADKKLYQHKKKQIKDRITCLETFS